MIIFILELEPYKYAGYPQLIKTIQMETSDEALFSKTAPLLAAGCELAYHTVSCSALNAEELRREGGLQVKVLRFKQFEFKTTTFLLHTYQF